MTELLEKAFNEAAKLSAEEQDKFAQWIGVRSPLGSGV